MRPNVLVVEDDVQTREALVRLLEDYGCAVDIATDGELAIGKIARTRYQAIVLDIALPKLSGTDVMEYVASTTPELLESIIVVTGLRVEEIRKLFPTVCETLSKPVMPTRLLASIRRCIDPPRDAAGISVA
jgi:DNA-binding response OmpR family regulator